MKILATVYQLDNVEMILGQADGIVVGIKGFSTRETSYFNLEELTNVSLLSKRLNKELFLSLKPILHEKDIDAVKTLFTNIDNLYFTGVIVGDIGYYYLLKELGVKNIIYNPETLLTNKMDVNEYLDLGLGGVFLAKEITLTDIQEILDNKKGNIFLTGHGYLNMFYSKRKLLKAFFEEINISYDTTKDGFSLKELTRENKYPVIEDKFGTHIYRSEISSVFKYLKVLEKVDYLLIDGIFHDDQYVLRVIDLFKNPSKEKALAIQHDYKQTWDEGFLFTKTIYKKEER